MSTRKLWVVTVTTEIYVLSESEPDPFDVEDMLRDFDPANSDCRARAVTKNVLGWPENAFVFGPKDDVTLKDALAEVNS